MSKKRQNSSVGISGEIPKRLYYLLLFTYTTWKLFCNKLLFCFLSGKYIELWYWHFIKKPKQTKPTQKNPNKTPNQPATRRTKTQLEKSSVCGWQQTSRIGWLVFVYLPYFPHASFLLANIRSMQKVRICCHRNSSFMLFWKIWKYNALCTQENTNVLSINRLICSYYSCCLRAFFKKQKQNKPSLFTEFLKLV